MFRTFILLDTGSIHPEAQNWASRVAANGGSVSPDTLKAVSDFCKETASIRSLFLRLNLFCGNNLNAALVPLYLGEAPGIVYGNTVDTNVNFVAGDYTERGINGGLIGNGVNKYLNTGFVPNSVAAMGLNDSSLSFYARTSNSSERDIGVTDASINRFTICCNRGSFVRPSINQTGLLSTTISTVLGLNLISRSVSGSLEYYFNLNSPVNVVGASSNKPNISVFIFAENLTGSPSGYSNRRSGGYHFGKNLTASQVAIFYNALQKFQTSLNRQV